MLPNHKVAGDPNSSNKKINLSNIELKLFNKHNVYSDQCLGAVHLFLNKKEEKIIKGFILIFYDHHKASVGKGYAQNNSHEQQICFCTQRKGHRQGHLGTILNTNNYENFVKIKFFILNSNFDQATQKINKKAILYGKNNYNNANYYGINMMSKIKAPIYFRHYTLN